MGTPKSQRGKNRQQIEKRAKGSQVFHINLKQLALRMGQNPQKQANKIKKKGYRAKKLKVKKLPQPPAHGAEKQMAQNINLNQF